MLETVGRLQGERLALAPYREDFGTRFWSVRDSPIWKIERQQDFRQPESASWVAFDEGPIRAKGGGEHGAKIH